MYCIKNVLSFTKNLSYQRLLIDLTYENRKECSVIILIPRKTVFVIQAFHGLLSCNEPKLYTKVTDLNIKISSITCSSRNLIIRCLHFSSRFMTFTCLLLIYGFQKIAGTSIKMPVKSGTVSKLRMYRESY